MLSIISAVAVVLFVIRLVPRTIDVSGGGCARIAGAVSVGGLGTLLVGPRRGACGLPHPAPAAPTTRRRP